MKINMVNIMSSMLNTLAVACMVLVSYFSIQDAQAQEMLGTVTEEDQYCLQQNIFFEARNQSVTGQVAVAWVTMNRVASPDFPDSVCEVVKQARRDSNGNPIRHQCQFSWYCDGQSDRIPDNVIAQRAWADAGLVAQVVLLDWAYGRIGPVDMATYYHANYVSPHWANAFVQVAVIDDHIFYVDES